MIAAAGTARLAAGERADLALNAASRPSPSRDA